MAIKPIYRKSPEYNISYNYRDLYTGTGYTKYYLANTYEASSENYVLTADTFRSDALDTSNSTASTSYTKVTDLDFNLSPFKFAQRIQGEAIMSLCGGVNSTAGTGNYYFIVKIRKWDGASETEIASSTSRIITITGGTNAFQDSSITISIPNQVSINVGEQLRVTVEVWAKNSGTGTTTAGIAHDPNNRTSGFSGGTYANTDTYINIPFVIDV